MTSFGKAFCYAILAAWTAVCVVPIYWLAMASLKGVAIIDKPPTYLPFVDFAPTLDAWRFILFDANDNLVAGFINSLIIGAAATGLALAAAGLAIYGLTRCAPAMRWATVAGLALGIGCGLGAVAVRGEALRAALLAGAGAGIAVSIALRRRGPAMTASGLLNLVLASRILPPVTLALPLYMLAVASGTRDTLALMIFVYAAINLPVAVWLLLPVLGPRATEQEEAAQIDGASHLGILFAVLLPMVRAGVAAAGLIVFLLCWNEYLLAAYLTADHALTLPPWAVGQLSMKEAQTGGGAEELAHLAAATILMMVPALAIAAFVHRSLGRSAAGG